MWRWLLVVTGCGRLDFEPVGLTYRDAVLADRPAVYLRLADADTTAADETGQIAATYNGTCGHQVPGALVGDLDPATEFSYTCTVSLGTALEFDGNAPYTVELWWNPENGQLTSHYLVMRETRAGSQPDDGYGMIASTSGFYFERSVSQGNRNTAPAAIPPNEFAHYVGVYDGATLFAYINGTMVGMRAEPRVMPAYSAVATLGGYLPSAGLIPGAADEFAIYDHALSPDRIALHHELGATGPR